MIPALIKAFFVAAHRAYAHHARRDPCDSDASYLGQGFEALRLGVLLGDCLTRGRDNPGRAPAKNGVYLRYLPGGYRIEQVD